MEKNELIQQWIQAKSAEKAANAERIRIEEQLFPLLKTEPGRACTNHIDNWKVTITRKFSRKVTDKAAALAYHQTLQDNSPFTLSFIVNETRWKKLKPEVQRDIADIIETKEAKPAFTIKEEDDA